MIWFKIEKIFFILLENEDDNEYIIAIKLVLGIL
jgi:hypothetical protein